MNAEGRQVLTVQECAEALGLSRGLTYEAVRSGRLPAVRVGRRWLVPKSTLDQFLASAKVRRQDATSGESDGPPAG